MAALSAAAGDVEELHGVRVEIASAGDCPVDGSVGAVVLAAREAMTNAAKFAGVEEIDVYAEVTDEEVSVFVRDRGAGFDRAAVPADRRGLVESIEGRLERAGGTRDDRDEPRRGHRGGAPHGEERIVKRRVVLVDDHDLFLSGVRAELGDAVDVVGQAGTVAAAVPLIKELDPDVVLLDVHLPDGSGDAIINQVAPERPG